MDVTLIKIIQYIKTQNEIMEKLLDKLACTNSWTRDKITYKFKNSDLEIKWGWEPGYDSGANVWYINSPDHMRIPYRYRLRVKKLIGKIDHREGSRANSLDFLNQYLNGDYCYSYQIENESISEITIWITEAKIFEYDIMSKKIGFRNESDAITYK